jgi:hypothetical protein
VDQPGVVRGVERAGGLAEEIQRRPGVELARLELACERGASLDQAHREEEPVLRLADLVGVEHVGMLDRSLEPAFPPKPRRQGILLDRRGAQNL